MTAAKLTPAGAADLDSLAKRIGESYETALDRAEQAVERAARCGQLLTEAKALVGHGEWLPWLAANVPEIAPRTAQKWMQLGAADLTTIEYTNGIDRALAAIATPPANTPTSAHLDEVVPEPATGAEPEPVTGVMEARHATLSEHARYFAGLDNGVGDGHDWDGPTDYILSLREVEQRKTIRLLYAAASNLAGFAEQVDDVLGGPTLIGKGRKWLQGARELRLELQGYYDWECARCHEWVSPFDRTDNSAGDMCLACQDDDTAAEPEPDDEDGER